MRLSLSSLRTRLLLLVVAAYIPAAVFTVWTIQRDRTEALDAVGARLRGLLAEASADNDAAITAGRRIIASWAEIPEIASGTQVQCERALARLSRYAPNMATPTRINAQGIVDCGGESSASIGQFVGENPLFTTVMASDSISLGPYLPGSARHPALLPLNLPLRNASGRASGVLSVGIRLDWLDRVARNVELPQGTLVTISDSTGLLIAHLPESPNIGQVRPGLNARFEEDRRKGMAAEGLTIRRTLDGVTRLIAHRQLQSAPGTFVRLGVAMPPSVAYAAPNARARARVALVIGTAFVALLLAWVGAQLLVLRDVDVILAATRKLGTGDLSARTGLDERSGEIGQIATSVDTMAAQLERRQERMRHAERLESLGRLAGGVAHDFNNMLTAIVGSADLALDALSPDHPAYHDLLSIKSSASRSSTLTRQLLDFSRRTPLSSAPQRLDVLVQEAVQLLGRVVPATVTLDVRTHSHRFVRVDAGRFEQALMNLAVNARDAMPNGGTLTIALDDYDVGETNPPDAPVPVGQWIRLRVTDTGSGMPPDVLRRVFEPFYTTKPVGEGTGLGLSMVYGTVQHHGGHVHVESVVGRGTCVTIWLPEAPPDVLDESIAAAPATCQSSGARVLVAEDQPEVRLLVQRVLSTAGFIVDVASTGSEALTRGLELGTSLQVLLTDYDMPELRGDAVALGLREQNPELPVVLMSGFTSEGWPTSLTESPYTSVVEKPFTAQCLLHAIDAACRALPVNSSHTHDV
ncbi:ATP-binding protein [Gemmatimonas phototrophica]|uniref:ATP-binding protein n=1 Tax=Gemmatimonas phototrophica TaxID=1379270 RepID=UPI0006A6F5AA|nr:ATP-binding protein [Gemmatimonas phototrophica]